MFGKLFEQIYDSSVADDWKVLVTWQQLIALADRHGVVDMTPEAIARRTNIPLEIITHGLAKLVEPDPRSRSPEAEGRRIVRLDEHREWGWRLVNHAYYRSLASAEEKRVADRDRQAHKRATERQSQSVAGSRGASPKSPMQRQKHMHQDHCAPRARDMVWEALLQACGIALNRPLTRSARGAYNTALRDIREAEAGLTDRDLVAAIWRAALAYRSRWPKVSLTPTALARRWHEAIAGVPGEQPKPTETAEEIERREAAERAARVRELSKLYGVERAEGETAESHEERLREVIAKAAVEARAQITARRRRREEQS